MCGKTNKQTNSAVLKLFQNKPNLQLFQNFDIPVQENKAKKRPVQFFLTPEKIAAFLMYLLFE